MTTMTATKIRFDRIMLAAIIISAAWHLFCMFAVTVVIAPKNSGSVKFSKVSFLGPILDRGALEVRVAQGERTFLEKRYLAQIGKTAPVIDNVPYEAQHLDLIEHDIHAANGEKIMAAVKDAVSASKLEPDYGIE
jgi:hypothetical protein